MKAKLLFVLVLLVAFAVNAFAGDHNKDGKRNYNNRVIQNLQLHPVNTPPVPFVVTPFTESFEGSFPPSGWANISLVGNDSWAQITAGTNPLPGWNGGAASTPPGGGSNTAYITWGQVATSNDEWLCTNQIMNIQPGDSLYFWLRKPGYCNAYLDNVDIKISTTTQTPPSPYTTMVVALVYPANSSDTTWLQRGYALTGFAPAGSNIYVGFREHVADNLNDGAAFQLDLVQVTSGTVGIHQVGTLVPKDYSLSQNYPNPFNPSTNLEFGIPKSGNVKVTVYDILGREVALVLNEYKAAGSYKINFDASRLTSGIYFYKIVTVNFTATKKMILVK